MRVLRDEGFTLLELMTVILVLGILVAIAVPGYVAATDRAADAVLEANAKAVADKVAELVLDERSVLYRKSGKGDSTFVSTALEIDLVDADLGNSQGFANPVSDSGAILNARSANGQDSRPAIFITDGRAYRYERIRTNPTRLAGTIIVQFNAPEDTIDVFFMDHDGERSELLFRRSVSDAVH